MLFLKNYFDKGLHHGANDAYNINKTLIKNDIDIITIDSDIKSKIYYLVLVLLNNSLAKKHKLKAPPIPRQSRSQLFNQGLVKRSNLAKMFKLDELYKVFGNISNFDL